MKEIILHVGHGKTGTSFLQSFLAINKQKLLDIGIDYPEHKSFEQAKKGNISSGNGAILYKEYLNIESISKKDTVLFSSEGFYTKLFEQTWFESFANEYRNKLKVILYTRNLFSFLFSSWGQKVKRENYTGDINEYLIKRGSSFSPTKQWLNLAKNLGFQLQIKNMNH